MKLKTHQRQSAVAGLVGLRGPDHAALLIQPTASGKTVTMATIIKAELLRYRPRVLVLQHTTPLFGQNLDELQKICAGARFASIGAGRTSRGLATADVTVATVQAARGETMGYLAPFDLAVIDEAHHAAAPIYREVIAVLRSRNPDLAVLGLTATPTRSDGQGIDFLFPRISHQVTFEDVLRSGLVVPPRVMSADLGSVSAALGTRAWSDGDDAEASKALRVEVTMDEVVRQHMALASGLRAVYFCCDTAHAEAMAAAFAGAGLRAAAVSYRTPKGKFKALLADFKAGAYDVLTNPMMLTEGFNDPGIGCVGLLRGFRTKELMVQAVGRGLRAHPGKRDGLVLDFVHAAERHGDLFPRMDISSRVKRGGAATARTNGEPAEIINADHVLMAEIDMLGGLLGKIEIGDAPVSKPVTKDGAAPVVMSRAEALALGLTKYFTGEPCKYGHIAARYVVTKGCSGCLVDGNRKRRQDADIRSRERWKQRERRKDPAIRAREYEQHLRWRQDPAARARTAELRRLKRRQNNELLLMQNPGPSR